MNGNEHALTDEQKAAMQDVRNQLGNDALPDYAHRVLMMQYPDLFENTGDDSHSVMYNWAAFKVEEVVPPAVT